MDKPVLVTGGDGWLGANIVGHLNIQGIGCEIVDLKRGGDIFDTKALEKAMRKCGAVIHLAGLHGPIPDKEEEDYKHINYEGSVGVVDTAHKVGIKCLVFASSNDIYGFSTGVAPEFPYHDKTKTPPLSKLHPYAKYKLMTEKYFRKVAKKYGMTIIALRLGGIDNASLPWQLSMPNLVDAFHKALLADIEGFHQINIANFGCEVNISRAKKLLGYEGK